MKHLTDDVAIALADGQTEPTAHAHTERCERCQGLVEAYRHLLATLSAESQGSPPLHLLRWARAYAGLNSPRQRQWQVLPMLARGAELLSVRGEGLTGGAYLYGDELHQLDIRIEPSLQGHSRLHGQLLMTGDEPVRQWTVTVIGTDGETAQTTTDEAGEFWLTGVTVGQRTTLVADRQEERIIVANLGMGEPAGYTS
jgi:hypothetical protein